MNLIKEPGKFEGEPTYVPEFWETVLYGMADEEWENQSGVLISAVGVLPEDVVRFPDLDGVKEVLLWEDEQGFVHHSVR